jgi:hypothetical protein
MSITGAGTNFTNALRYGATMVQARFTPYVNGVPISKPYTASMSNGTVTVARNSAQRRTANIVLELIPTVPVPILMPADPSSLLSPFGTEIFLETGIASTVGGTGIASVATWIPLGLFTIVTTDTQDTTTNLVVSLTLSDRSFTISQRAFLQPYNIPAVGGNFSAEIQALLNMVWAQDPNALPLQYNITPTSETVPTASFNQGADPWTSAVQLATAIGYELFFDVNGIVTAFPVPDPLTQPITWNYTDSVDAIEGFSGTGSQSLLGSPYSTPAAVTNTMTRSGIYNDIVIQGTGTSNAPSYSSSGTTTTPALATAADNNPQSPTYIKGGLGNVPDFVASSLVTTSGAQDMANTQLQVALSSSWTVTLQIPPNPIFDIDDVVTVTRPRVGLNNAKVVIDTITHAVNYADLTSFTGRILSNTNSAVVQTN